MRDEGWVVGVADDYTADTFSPAVGVEGIGFECELIQTTS